MNPPDSLEALRRANPRREPGYDDMLDRLASAALDRRELTWDRASAPAAAWPRRAQRVDGTSAVAVPVGAGLLVAATVAIVVLTFWSPAGPRTVSPAAAMERAVEVTAASAEASGTVLVEITRDGHLWAAKTVHWNGSDLSISDDHPLRSATGELLVIDGMMYGHDVEAPNQWVELGSPDSIDPGSGTTPDDYLAAVREDAGGETLRRVTAAMSDLTTSAGEDGSIVYEGHVPAGDLARETGTKEGQAIRVLPYGYVAHDDASDPSSPIAVTITVGADDIIRRITATWGGASTWTYVLTFDNLGSAPGLAAPTDARPLLACRLNPERPDC
jgi:hypothetical protein